MSDLIERQAAIDAITRKMVSIPTADEKDLMGDVNRIRTEDISVIKRLPSAQPEPSMEECACCVLSKPERKWIPCSNPPKHHKDVIVRGIEAIGNVTVHKVMQWDVDMWRPTDYAPSVMWKEWSEI